MHSIPSTMDDCPPCRIRRIRWRSNVVCRPWIITQCRVLLDCRNALSGTEFFVYIYLPTALRSWHCRRFLANVNTRSCSLFDVARPSVVCLSFCLSVVCNVRAPYSSGWKFRQCTLATHWYPRKILRRSSQRNPSVAGVKGNKGSQI